MRISDWSSDVCSSDLIRAWRNIASICRSMSAAIRSNSANGAVIAGSANRTGANLIAGSTVTLGATSPWYSIRESEPSGKSIDRKSDVEGKSGDESVNLGGRRTIKKKKKNKKKKK